MGTDLLRRSVPIPLTKTIKKHPPLFSEIPAKLNALENGGSAHDTGQAAAKFIVIFI
jgi:hypothetical protein